MLELFLAKESEIDLIQYQREGGKTKQKYTPEYQADISYMESKNLLMSVRHMDGEAVPERVKTTPSLLLFT